MDSEKKGILIYLLCSELYGLSLNIKILIYIWALNNLDWPLIFAKGWEKDQIKILEKVNYQLFWDVSI